MEKVDWNEPKIRSWILFEAAGAIFLRESKIGSSK